jgi:hypothetical protein
VVLRDDAVECALKGEGARGAHCILVVHVSAQGLLWVDLYRLHEALVLVQCQEALFHIVNVIKKRLFDVCVAIMRSAIVRIYRCTCLNKQLMGLASLGPCLNARP